MGLFGLFKKNTNYFDKKIQPKCAYCENGKPAKSEGHILCTRCGIVSEDYSCKKFTYSPFLRVPEKEHPAEECHISTKSEISDKSAEKTDTNTSVPEPASEENLTPEKSLEDEPILQENIVENELPSKENVHNNINETVQTENITSIDNNEKTSAETLDEKSTEENKKEAPIQNEASCVSDIKFNAHDNSENIKHLETIKNVNVAEIENHVPPKEIVLPDVSQSSVSSISNSPEVRNSDDYLKTVSLQSVVSIENNSNVTHTLPEGTENAELSDFKK